MSEPDRKKRKRKWDVPDPTTPTKPSTAGLPPPPTRKWDVPDPAAPPPTASTTSTTTITTTTTPTKPNTNPTGGTPTSTPAKSNPTSSTPTKPAPPATTSSSPASSSGSGNKSNLDKPLTHVEVAQQINEAVAMRAPAEIYTSEIEINSCPAATRYRLTKGTEHEQIHKETGAVVITRGVFVAAHELPQTTSKPLHLHISAKTKENLLEAEKKIREMMRASKESAVLGALLSDKVPITMEVEPEFNLNGKLLGPKGQYLRNITNESGAKVLLKGKDASPNATEADQLHIHITANSQAVLDRAKKLAMDHIASVQKQYEEFKQKKSSGPHYPMSGYHMPYMPPYPYPPYPPYHNDNFPPPPYSGPPFPPRGPGFPPGFPPPPPFSSQPGTAPAYPPNYYSDTPPTTGSGKTNNHHHNTHNHSGTADHTKETSPSSNTSQTGSNSESSKSYDPLNYYNYGYPQYDSYSYQNYNYYPGTAHSESPSHGGIENNKANSGGGSIPSDQRTNSYGYNYNSYGDEAQPYSYDTNQPPYYTQNPTQN